MADRYEVARRLAADSQARVDNAKWILMGIVKQVRKKDLKVIVTILPEEADTNWIKVATPFATNNGWVGGLPAVGSTVLVFCIGADPNNAFVMGNIFDEDDTKPTLNGDNDIYVQDTNGNKIVMSSEGLQLTSTIKVKVNAPQIVLNDGTKPIARLGDAVSTPVGPGAITAGNTTILA